MPRISCVLVRFFCFSHHPSLPSRSLQRRHELPSPTLPDHARLSSSTPGSPSLGPSLSPHVVAPPSPLTSSEWGSAPSPPPASSANAGRRCGRELRCRIHAGGCERELLRSHADASASVSFAVMPSPSRKPSMEVKAHAAENLVIAG
jgi:hypothetical protein